jgi:hypothetical protein
MWIESFPAWTFKDQADGSLWWKASANIASVHIGTLVPETGLLGEVLFSGTGSIVNVGLWVPTVDGWFMPSEERMNLHIMATVFDDDGNEWALYWQYVMRDGKVNETYRFEPAK